LKNERDDLEKANISAQKLVTKLKEEKTLWQNKFLNLLEGKKRPREENAETSGSKRRADPKSEHYYEDKSASTLEEVSSSKSGRASKNKSPRNTLENESSSSHATKTSRRHTSSSTSAHTDRGRTDSIIDHPHLSRVVEMDEEQGKRAVRAELNMDIDPWTPPISRWGQRLVTLALWKREVRGYQRYVPDYSDRKAAIHRTSHDANIRVGLTAFKDFAQVSQEWTYQEAVKHSHDEFSKYHLRNYIPRVVGDYWKITTLKCLVTRGASLWTHIMRRYSEILQASNIRLSRVAKPDPSHRKSSRKNWKRTH
jgi:hypothetical protein